MSRLLAIVIAAVLLLLLMFLAIWFQGPAIEADISARAQNVLAAQDAAHLRVDVNGQHVTLVGSVTNPALARQATESVAALWGVVDVQPRLDVIAPGSPLVTSDERGRDGVVGTIERLEAPIAEPVEEFTQAAEQPGSIDLAPEANAEAGVVAGANAAANAGANAGANAPDVDPAVAVPVDEPNAGAEGAQTQSAAVIWQRDERQMSLRGEVNDAASRDRLLQAVRALHPARSLNAQLNVVAAPALPWSDLLRAIEIVRDIPNARVALDSDGLQVNAGGGDLDQSLAVRDALKASGLPLSELVVDVPDAGTDDCQNLYNELLAQDAIGFASNSSNIETASHGLLDRLAFALGQCEFAVEIAGHTDATGDPGYNLWLSQRRADAVRDYLLEQAVSTQIISRGYGAQRPVADNATAAGRRANRRIEFNITP